MRRSRVLLRVCALGLGAAVALAPITAASAKTKAPTGINRNSSFCKLLISQQSASQKYETKIESAFSSGNLAKSKSAVVAEFNYGTKSLAGALAAGKVPAPIEAALKYFLKLYAQEKTQINSATSLTGIETALTSLTKVPKFSSESKTVSSYVATQCGSLTTTT